MAVGAGVGAGRAHARNRGRRAGPGHRHRTPAPVADCSSHHDRRAGSRRFAARLTRRRAPRRARAGGGAAGRRLRARFDWDLPLLREACVRPICLVLAATAAALGLAGAAGSRPAAAGLGPYRGLATWVDIYDPVAWKRPEAVVEQMRAR